MGTSVIEDLEQDAPTPPGQPQTYGDGVGTPDLLDPNKDPAEICKYLHEQWEAQRDKYQRLICEGEVNERRRDGEVNIWVRKLNDQSAWQVYTTHGPRYAAGFSRKDDRLAYRFVSQLYADPPQPEAIPSTGEDADRDAAEFTTRVLLDVGSESGLDDLEGHKQAQHTACSWGSGFLWYYTDPKGGGRQAVEVMAPLEAQSMADVRAADGQNYTGPRRPMYVLPDGTLSGKPNGAALQWMPRLARQLCRPDQVRFWPHTSTDLWDADGLLYADYQPWGVLKGWFQELENVSDEERAKALKFRLSDSKHLLPKKNGRPHDPQPKAGHEDDGLALLMIYWAQECGNYPDGAYIVTVGETLVAHQGTWVLDVEGRREKRDLPFTQVLQWRGGKDYPMGKPLMSFLGALDELRAELTGKFGEWLDSLMNQKWFLTPHSTVTSEMLQDPFLTLIPTMPGTEPKPMIHPPVPRELPAMLDMTAREMDDASSLQQTGQALDTGDVNSGRQALAIISQVQAGLQDVLQNANRAWTRGKRVQIQEIKANYSRPQLLRVTTPDGAYKVERFQGADLGSTRDVQIKRGTGTGMNPFQKTMMLAEFGKLYAVDPEDLKDIALSGVSHITAIQDSEITLRIRRQLYEWEKGPPPGWKAPQAPVDDAGMPLMRPVQGAMPSMNGGPLMEGPGSPMRDGGMLMPPPMEPVPPPPDPILVRIWEPVPADRTPIAAQRRLREIAKSMCKAKYTQFPPEWRLPVEMEFQAMQAVLAPAPMPMPEPGKEPPKKPPAGPGKPPALQQGEAAVIGESATEPQGAMT